MKRKLYALTLSTAVALSCAMFVSNSFAGMGGGGAGGGAGNRMGGGAGAGGGAGGAGGAAGGGAGRGAGGGGRFGGGGAAAPTGDPAPVPPEVAIPRPSAADFAKFTADLHDLALTNTGPDKDILKTNANLINLLAMPRLNTAIYPTAGGVRAGRHQAFVDRAKQGDCDILFEGDSITDWWQSNPTDGGKAVQAKYFADNKIANFAVAGDTTQGVLWGLQNGEGRNTDGTPVAIKPKAIMLMIGTNNAGRNNGPEIAEGNGAIVLELRKDFPDAKILLLAIFPRGTGPTDNSRVINEEANKIIAKLDDQKHVFFMNINKGFLNDNGSLKGFRGDNLHPTEIGYTAWAEAVAPTLKGWLK